ncbi:MAG: hypothetical protein IJH43_00635 [Mogibacterium sp.]|nr:hypothetical protein [Mogibacterium sp.]
MNSLFEYISSAVVDGELPRDFSLPDITDENELRWADGAQDGVAIYHMSIPEVSKDDRTLISDALRAASIGVYSLADEIFEMLGRHTPAIILIDDLQSYILENKSKLNAENLFEYAMHLLFESDDRECVKFGLSVLELFKTDRKKDLKGAIRTIGLSDEFALFAIFVMLHWENSNQEIWELAKRVHGWGRIHAIERIEPDTEEIRHWLLMEGVHNDVMPAYSALTCWEKSDAGTVLRNGPSKEEFSAIGDIIAGLLDEGPVTGISELPDCEEIISVYLDVAGKMVLTEADREVVNMILEFYREKLSDTCPIAVKCRELLHLD